MIDEEIKKGLSTPLTGYNYAIFRTNLTASSPSKRGMQEAFNWLELQIGPSRAPAQAPTPKEAGRDSPPNPRDSDRLSKKLEEWGERAEGDMSPEEFIKRFHAYDLPSWDHYTHIRLAYLILIGHGRRKGQCPISLYGCPLH